MSQLSCSGNVNKDAKWKICGKDLILINAIRGGKARAGNTYVVF